MCDWSGIVEVIAQAANQDEDFKYRLEERLKPHMHAYQIKTSIDWLSRRKKYIRGNMTIEARHTFREIYHSQPFTFHFDSNEFEMPVGLESIFISLVRVDRGHSDQTYKYTDPDIDNLAYKISSAFMQYILHDIIGIMIISQSTEKINDIIGSNFAAPRILAKDASKR